MAQTHSEDIGGAHSLTVSKTEDAILDIEDGASTSSNKTVEIMMHSDDECDFDTDLPTGFEKTDTLNPVKGLVVKGAKPEANEGKPEMTMKSSKQKSEASNLKKSKIS